MERALSAVLAHGASLAEPGEFTRTAFMNGKLALSDAEGIAEFNQIDHMHLTKNGHTALAKKLSEIVPELV